MSKPRITDPETFYKMEEINCWEELPLEDRVEILRRLLEDVIFYLKNHEKT